MKNRILNYSLLILAVAIMFSCKKDEVYAPKIASDGQIQFQVADAVLTGTAFNGAVQPSFNVASARFSRATVSSVNYVGGNIVITANLSSNMTNLKINYLTTNSATAPVNPGQIAREEKASFSGISGTVTWTQPIAALTYKGVAVANGTYILEFVASNADGSVTTTRVFSLVIIA